MTQGSRRAAPEKRFAEIGTEVAEVTVDIEDLEEYLSVCPPEREIDVRAQIQRLRERRGKLKEEFFGCIEHTQRKIRDARAAALAIDHGEAAAQAGASSAANQESASASAAPPQPTPSTSSQGAVAARPTGAIPKVRANWVPTEVYHLRAQGVLPRRVYEPTVRPNPPSSTGRGRTVNDGAVNRRPQQSNNFRYRSSAVNHIPWAVFNPRGFCTQGGRIPKKYTQFNLYCDPGLHVQSAIHHRFTRWPIRPEDWYPGRNIPAVHQRNPDGSPRYPELTTFERPREAVLQCQEEARNRAANSEASSSSSPTDEQIPEANTTESQQDPNSAAIPEERGTDEDITDPEFPEFPPQ